MPCAEPSAPSAANSALVTIWLVSTLPATTAAGYVGRSIEPSGMTISMGFRQPAFIGIGSSTMTRNV